MTPTEPATYDFRKPRRLADDVEYILSAWHNDACSAIADRWALHFGVTAGWSAGSLETTRSSELASSLDKPFLAYSFVLRDDTEPTWMIVPRTLAIAFIASMFGDLLEAMPDDRALTDVEQSLAELAMSEVANALTESQPCPNPIKCQLRGERHPRELTRTFPDQEQITVATFTVEAPFGAADVQWILSQPAVLSFATHVGECRLDRRSDRGEMEKIVRKIPLEVVVRLGETDVHVSDLVNLQIGDIVLLNQRVSDPLIAEVAGTTKFQGWPGKMGTTQAFQIEAYVAQEDN